MSGTQFLARALRLIDNGYWIIPIPPKSKAPTIDAWQEIRAAGPDARRWAANGYGKGGGLGLLTGVEHDGHATIAADNDTLDPELSRQTNHYLVELFAAKPPMRVGNAPKTLMLLRAEQPFGKVQSARWKSPDGNYHKLEFLGTGQQFVGFGVHPDTGFEFDWITAQTPLDTRVDELPVITEELARTAVAWYDEQCRARGWERASKMSEVRRDDDDQGDDPRGIDMRPKLHITTAEIREALKEMEGADDYDVWCRVGMGLHHQFDGSREGFELWDEWSRSCISKYDKDALEYRWGRSFKGAYEGRAGPITVAFIVKAWNKRKREAGDRRMTEFITRIGEATTTGALSETIIPEIRDADVGAINRSVLVRLIGQRIKKLTGAAPDVKMLRAAMSGRATKDNDELEIALARRVLDTRFESGAHLIRYAKSFFGYEDGCWYERDEDLVRRAILETLTDLHEVDDPMVRKLLERKEESRGDRLMQLVGTIFSALSSLCAIEGDDPLKLNETIVPRIVNFQNCEVLIDDLGRVTKKSHDPQNFFFQQMRCDFDPSAPYDEWTAMLERVFRPSFGKHTPEMIQALQERIGYLMQRCRDKAFYLLIFGPGNDGKSFIFTIVNEIMGQNGIVNISMTELSSKNPDPHFTARLLHKLIALDDDYKAGLVMSDEWFKKLSEAKSMTANPKNKGTYNFMCRAGLVVLANGWPTSIDPSHGMMRRADAIQLKTGLAPGSEDPSHLTRILAQRSGIATQCVLAYAAMVKRGHFLVPQPMQEARKAFIAASNPVLRFLTECVEQTDKRGDRVTGAELYDQYKRWARYHEENIKQMGRTRFYEALERHRIPRRNHAHITMFTGIRLIEVDFQDEATRFENLDDGLDDGLDQLTPAELTEGL